MIPLSLSRFAKPKESQKPEKAKAKSKSTTPVDESKAGKSKKLATFRTITTLIKNIQQLDPTVSLPDSPLSLEDTARHLQLSTAFCTLAATEHDVVAIATKMSLEALSVTICANLPWANEQDNMTEPTPSLTSRFWNIFLTRNTRLDDTESRYPIASSPSPPDGINSTTLTDYLFECQWSSLNFASRIWIIKHLLALEDREVRHTILTLYTLVTCHKKIKRRLNSRHSRTYLESLRQVPVAEISLQDKRQDQSEPRPKPGEIESDVQFLNFFLPKYRLDHPECLYPELAKIAELPSEDQGQLYSEITCQEFHWLLLKLLELFQQGLKELEEEFSGFPASLDGLRFIAYGLQRLCRGAALQMHLYTIERFLDPFGYSDRYHEDGLENRNERDEDLIALQSAATEPGQRTPLWKSYRDWLRLLLGHIDAVELLTTLLLPQLQLRDIHVMILSMPPPRTDMVSFEYICTQLSIPTTISAPLMAQGSNGVTSGRFVCFLRAAQTACNKKDHDAVKMNLRAIKNSEDKGDKRWQAMADAILSMLPVGEPSPQTWADVTQKVLTFMRDVRFISSLTASEIPKFEGSLHCEASLATLLGDHLDENDPNIKELKNMVKELEGYAPVIGVSKRCCPTCARLLCILGGAGSNRFAVRGSHNTITACTLPPWIPEGTVDQMIQDFGKHLRDELMRYMQSTQTFADRSPSTGSDTHSISSLDRVNEQVPHNFTSPFYHLAQWKKKNEMKKKQDTNL